VTECGLEQQQHAQGETTADTRWYCTVRRSDTSRCLHSPNRWVVGRAGVAHLDPEGAESVALTTEWRRNQIQKKQVLPMNHWGFGE